MSTGFDNGTVKTPRMSRFANSWAILPMRAFLGALFVFAGYAKFSYPGFFDPKSQVGLKATIDAVKADSPIGGLLGPLSSHSSLFGHVTAVAEIAIGLGLLVGLLARIAALGGIALTTLIALTVNWNGIKQYTASSGWFTSVDIAVAVALTVFVIGGAGPLSLDRAIWAARTRRLAKDDGDPSFNDSEIEDSRRRLRGDGIEDRPADPPTQQLPVPEATPASPPEPDPNSLWTQGRRESGP
jgi:thiosulfate dehydrogenase [quinone] large subunit